METYLDKLMWLYLHMPISKDSAVDDLRKAYDRYLPVLAFITSFNEDYRIATSQLNERALDVHILISVNEKTTTTKEREMFYQAAHNFLKADIKSLIEIIEIRSKKNTV